jgi:hypothetical protein
MVSRVTIGYSQKRWHQEYPSTDEHEIFMARPKTLVLVITNTMSWNLNRRYEPYPGRGTVLSRITSSGSMRLRGGGAAAAAGSVSWSSNSRMAR